MATDTITELDRIALEADQAAQAAQERARAARLQLLEARRAKNLGPLREENEVLHKLDNLQLQVTSRLADLKQGMEGLIASVCEQEVDDRLAGRAPDLAARQRIRDAEDELRYLRVLAVAVGERLRVASSRVAIARAQVSDPDVMAKAPGICQRCPSCAECSSHGWQFRAPDGSCPAFGRPAFSQMVTPGGERPG